MGWIALLWLIAVFALFYVALPALACGHARQGSVVRRIAWTVVVNCFVLHFAILLLGPTRLALPGLVLVLLAAWLTFEAIRHRPRLLQPATWVGAAMQLIEGRGRTKLVASVRDAARGAVQACDWKECGLWLSLFGTYLFTRSFFAAENLRFLDSENYSRSLSLAILSSGQPWQLDSSVPLLLPLQILSALPSTAIVRFSGPIVSVLFVLAVAFVAFEYTRSRTAALLASMLCMVVPVWRGAMSGTELGAAELAAVFAVAGAGLAKRSPFGALLGFALAVGISVASPFVTTVVAGISCAVGGAAIARTPLLLPIPWRSSLRALAVAATIVTLSWRSPLVFADGPHQYEAAARASDWLARNSDRNSWLLISTAEEVPFLYGRGWHVPLTSFATEYTPGKLADRSFRFKYPVRDIFIFVERQPLRTKMLAQPVATFSHQVPSYMDDRLSTQRASLQFKVARLLAAYQQTHSDLTVISANDRFTVYHLPGALKFSKH